MWISVCMCLDYSSWQANGRLNVSRVGSAQHYIHAMQYSQTRKRSGYRDTQKASFATENLQFWPYLRGWSSVSSQHQVQRSMGSPRIRNRWRNQMSVDLCLLCFKYTQNTSASFRVELPNEIPGLQFWIVAKVRYYGCCQYIDYLLKFSCRLTNVTW